MRLNELLDKLCGDITIEVCIYQDDGSYAVKSLTLDEYKTAVSQNKDDEFADYVVDEISLAPFYGGDISIEIHENHK